MYLLYTIPGIIQKRVFVIEAAFEVTVGATTF